MTYTPFEIYIYLNDHDDFVCMLLEEFNEGFAQVVRFPTAEKFLARPQDLMKPSVYFSTPFGDIPSDLEVTKMVEALEERTEKHLDLDRYNFENSLENIY